MKHVGKIVKINDKNFVQVINETGTEKTYPIFNGKNFKFEENQEVNFSIVDEFTHPDLFEFIPWGEGLEMAMIFR